jgi:hypothetical protein
MGSRLLMPAKKQRMTPPQTAAQRKAAKLPAIRQAELEARKAAAGLKRVCVWAHPDDAAAIRAAAAQIAATRLQSSKAKA